MVYYVIRDEIPIFCGIPYIIIIRFVTKSWHFLAVPDSLLLRLQESIDIFSSEERFSIT